MYRINNCFCKLRKRIEELEAQVKENYSGDTNLANKVQQIKNELDENTEKDAELRDFVSSGGNLTPSSEDNIDTLFP